MEALLLALPLILCPLAMTALGGFAWLWAKARRAPAAHDAVSPALEPSVAEAR